MIANKLARIWPAFHPPFDIPLASGVLLMGLTTLTHYWYDESFTALLSRLPNIQQVVEITRLDVHPPLHYILTWFMAHSLGSSEEFVTRGLSVIFQILALIMFWYVMDLLKLDLNIKIPSLFFMGFAPIELVYGSEGRMYALLQLLVMVQIWAMLGRRWIILAVASLLAMYTHNYGVIYTGLMFLIAMARELSGTTAHVPPIKNYYPGQREYPASQFKALFISFAAPMIAFIPWVFYGLIPQMQFVGSGRHWMQPLTSGDALWSLFKVIQTTNYPKQLGPIMYMVVMGGLVLATLAAVRAKRIMLLSLAFGPWLLACLVSFLITPILLFRALIPSVPFIFIILVSAVVRASPSWQWIGKATMLTCFMVGVIGLAGDISKSSVHGTDLHPMDYSFPDGATVGFIDDTALITFLAYPQPGVQYVYLDVLCGEQLGALGSDIRGRLGIKTLSVKDLPDQYYWSGTISALANQCQADQFTILANKSIPIKTINNKFGITGMYYVSGN